MYLLRLLVCAMTTQVDFANVPFSSVFSDHMLAAQFHDGHWTEGEIQPYGPISISPSVSALHYGVSAFAGMKAHKSPDGRPLLFRPRENARRLQRFAARLAMPAVPESIFLDDLRELVRLDQAWIPPVEQGALYIRPILFSVDPSIRVKPAESCPFMILTFPFGAYFAAPVDVPVSEQYVRAFPGVPATRRLPGTTRRPYLPTRKLGKPDSMQSCGWMRRSDGTLKKAA
jgi:branched-chain amino acid aminotransferase